MKKNLFTLLIASFCAALIGCGSGSGSQTPAPTTSSVKTAGDSLSDIGTFGFVFTVQTSPASMNWTQAVATSVGFNSMCPRYAPTSADLLTPILNPKATACTAYAVGGATISGNEGNGWSIITQLENMAAAGIGENDLVLINGGGNDAVAVLSDTPVDPVQLAKTFSDAIKRTVLASKVKRVIVANIPDVTLTPRFQPYIAYKDIVQGWVKAFNDELLKQFATEPRVMIFDLYAELTKWASTPQAYGITNATDAACPANAWGFQIAGCTSEVLNSEPGKVANWWTTYLFSDYFHPTPKIYQMFADHVNERLKARGWFY